MFHAKAIGLVLAGVISGAAIAGPATVGGFHGRLLDSPLGKLITGNVGRWLVLRSELNVTPEQKAKILATVAGHKAEIAKAAKGIFDQRVVLRDAVLSGKDEKTVRAAADGLAKSIGDAAVLASQVVGEVKPVLTPEQQQMIHKTHGECDQAVERFLTQAMQTP